MSGFALSAACWRGLQASTIGAARAAPALSRSLSTDAGQPYAPPLGSSSPGAAPGPASTSDSASTAGAASTSAATPGVSAQDLGDYTSFSPKLVVFGGNGFVGSHVCQEGLKMGLDVTSVNRSGRPTNLPGDWVNRVHWVQGDALDPQQPWKEALKGSLGVVSTLGAFGNNDFMYKVNGTANIRAMEAAKEAGVPRFAFISVHDYRLPYGWQAQNFLLRGYFQGKRDAEKRLAELFPEGGVALRPGPISGTRRVGTASLPLGLIYTPMKAVLSLLPTHSLVNTPIVGFAFVPPVKVDAVAKAAVNAVLDPTIPPGIMDVWKLLEYEK